MSVKLIEELEQRDKEIARLKSAIRGALQCRDLWGNPSDLSHIEECHLGEVEMLAAMENEFRYLLSEGAQACYKTLVQPDVSGQVCDHKDSLEKGYEMCDRCSKWLV